MGPFGAPFALSGTRLRYATKADEKLTVSVGALNRGFGDADPFESGVRSDERLDLVAGLLVQFRFPHDAALADLAGGKLELGLHQHHAEAAGLEHLDGRRQHERQRNE